MELTAVASFIALAGERHFGRTAASLGISVSALSKRIQRLELELGVPLVLRDSGGFLGLTPAGDRFVRFAPELLRAAQAATQAAAGEPSTTLRLAVPAGVGVVAPLLPTALTTLELALNHAHPGTAIESVPTPFIRLTDSLLAGEVDAVLTFGRSADPAVASTQLSQIHRVGMVAAIHPLGSRHSVDVHEFARYPMIYGAGLPDEYMHPFVLADVRPLDQATLIAIDATNTADVAQRVLRGVEVTVVPLALTGNLPPELRRIELRGAPPHWYHAQRREGDDRPELMTAINLMGEFTESITRVALPRR